MDNFSQSRHASYIKHWAKKLKEDEREIFHAAADAQRIADLALRFHPDYAATLKAERESYTTDAVPRAVPSVSYAARP